MRNGSTIIQELRKGSADAALGEALNAATERVKITGKPAKVVLTLTIEPADKNAEEVDQVWVEDEITLKLPKLAQKNTLFFLDTESNDLSRDNPQRTIPGIATKSA